MTEATKSLIKTLLDASSSNNDMLTAASSFLAAARQATSRETEEALGTLGQYLDLDEPSRAGVVALVCGALVEGGCQPMIVAGPLIKRLRSLLESAVTLADTCTLRMRAVAKEDKHPGEVFDAVRKQVGISMPQQNAAWEALEQFWPAAIALLSVSAELRATARPLRILAARISQHHAAGHWLRLMLSVLANEPMLVIEPETRLALLARISGVVDNFQLNVLLMDAFPRAGIFSRRRVPQTVIDIARGSGPQQSNEIVTGVWNLYTWQSLKQDRITRSPTRRIL